ncbi:MAG: SCO family protein [Nannocystis sp.]|nr:SCO family protein [Nannocystis sp.]MBA3545187.1 SCO family protein [Nannocystis sp.]
MASDSDRREFGMAPPGERGGWLQRSFVRYPWHFGVGLLLLVITGTRPFMRNVPEPPPVLLQVPDFALQDQDGRPFTLASMRGKVWVAGFIFTTCPSVCPKISRAMLDLQQRYARNGIDVELISFTVDPENDTPAVLKRYAENLGADQNHWRFVTGERAAMEALVVGGFKTAMDRRDAGASDAVDMYDIAHSEKLVLIDPEGGIRGFYGVRRPKGAPVEPLPMGVHTTPEAEALGLDALSLDELYHRSTHVLRAHNSAKAGCGR